MVGAAPRRELGPYVICERIGVGGMATVHRAIEHGLEGIERVVALKRLLPHFTCDEAIVRGFVREARLGLLLQHANIAHTYTLGRVGTDYFIAMEFVDGCSLQRVLEHARAAGPPPIPVAVALARQICDALEYAHLQRDLEGRPLALVHRDLSPSNLLLSRSGHVKLIDFGIAQSVHTRTQTERIKGKLAYMAPEAIAGEPLDARSDLFALGVVFYELLVARPLFPQQGNLTDDRPTIPPPTSRRGDLPEALDDVVMRALETDPKQRWGSAAEFRAALLAASPSVATPSEIAEWCEPAFAIDNADVAETRDVRLSEDSSAVVLADVPDFTGVRRVTGANIATSPQVPIALRKIGRAKTISTQVVPPPERLAARGSTPPVSSEVTPTPARTVASVDDSGKLPLPTLTTRPSPRRLRIDLRIVIGVISGAAIGITILIVTGGGPKRAEPVRAEPAQVIEATPVMGTVTLDVTPANATIVVGNLPPHEGSPWTLEMLPGHYEITVTAPEHDKWSTTLIVAAGRTQLVGRALTANKIEPVASAILAIDSSPTNLEVTLDGKPLPNRTPIRTGVVPGAHDIVVRDGETVVWQTTFVAKDNQSHRFTAFKPVRKPPSPPAETVVEDTKPSEPTAATPDAAFVPSQPPLDDRAPQ
jgi:serine/threonine protein kinase